MTRAAVPANFQPRRILLVKPSALGDIVHAIPVLTLLRQRFRAAKIDWLVTPSFAGLLRNHPDLNELVIFDRKRASLFSDHAKADATDVRQLAQTLADRDYDLVIDLQGLIRSAFLSWSTHAPVRVGFGYAREGAWLAYTHRVPARDVGTARHAVERYLDVAEALGCARGPVEFRFPALSSDDRAIVDERLAPLNGAPFAALLPGTNWATKRWPAAHYAALATQVRAKLDLEPVIAGGADVVELAQQMPGTLDLSNRTSLPQLVELLRRASLVIANDSGPMHIACALGRPLVTIFGPTNPARTGPYARPDTVIRLNIICSPCYSRTCSHTSCMNWLTPEHVLEQARQALVTAPRASAALESPAPRADRLATNASDSALADPSAPADRCSSRSSPDRR